MTGKADVRKAMAFSVWSRAPKGFIASTSIQCKPEMRICTHVCV